MNQRGFTKFSRHSNNTNEVVDAGDINKIQESVNIAESKLIKTQSEIFTDKALYFFDNNLYANSIYIDTYNDKSLIDVGESENIIISSKLNSVKIKDTSARGKISSILFKSTLGDNIDLNDFFIITEENKPLGTVIEHFLVTEKNEVYPIVQGNNKPLTFATPLKAFRIISYLYPSDEKESPELYGLAALFFDIAVESQYGLSNPDISRYEQTSIGVTTLVRDRAQQDKLIKIIEPSSTVSLQYAADGTDRLQVVETYYDKDNIKVKDELHYGDYENSKGETENVLLSISTSQTRVTNPVDKG